MASAKIRVVRTTTDNQEVVRRINEDAGETFESGTPVALDGSGRVIAWDGSTESGLVGSPIGVASEAGNNLTTAAIPEQLGFGSVPYQSAAVNIPRGAPPNDGRMGVFLARIETEFFAQINPTGQSLLESDVGTKYGMTIDSDGHWYIDKAKVTPATNTVVKITKRDPLEDNLADNVRRGAYFQFDPLYTQVLA